MDIATAASELLRFRGVNLVGFADLSGLPGEVRAGMPRAISFVVALRPDIVDALRDGPTRAYHAEYQRVNELLGELSTAAARFLQEQGFHAVPSAATNEGIDPATLSTRLPHKTVATLAGLGWIGKCALLVTEVFGSAVRLNRVLTDAPLPTAKPVTESRCGTCTACVTACPGHAPSGKTWTPDIVREEIFSAVDCRRAARRIAMERAGIDETCCGMCIAVCPHTRKYVERTASPE